MDWEQQPEPQEEPALGIAGLTHAFRDQLFACLEECAAGRRGLFVDREHLPEDEHQPWPEAARLRELAFALQAILNQSSEHLGKEEQKTAQLCEQFLDLCSIHGESDPGESRLARAFLNEIAPEGIQEL